MFVAPGALSATRGFSSRFGVRSLVGPAAGRRRSLSFGLLGLSGLIAAFLAFGDDGALAYNNGSGRARWLDWSAPLVDLPRAFPSFFRAVGTGVPRASAIQVHLVTPAIVWAISLLVGWIFFRLLVVRVSETVSVRALVTSCCLLGVLALGVSANWSLAGGTHVTSTRSQLRLLRNDDPQRRSYGVRLPRHRTSSRPRSRGHTLHCRRPVSKIRLRAHSFI